jgi:hypothetical protein
MKAAGGKKALCVNHEVGNVALDRRCAGSKKVLVVQLISWDLLIS